MTERPSRYVALGSSFAAGLGLGPRAPKSPLVCMRSINGYPQQLARQYGLALVDATCSGATATHVLRGGQMFMGPQIDAVTPETELVTLTAGGNDIGYVGDLTFMSASGKRSVIGWAVRRFWKGPRLPAQRDHAKLQKLFVEILEEIGRRAPKARIVVVTYPTILPPEGSCAKLGLDAAQVASMREVGERLAETTRQAALQCNALLVDMHHLGAAHHACAENPWVNGSTDVQGTQFHPTLAGAQAAARAIAEALRLSPAVDMT